MKIGDNLVCIKDFKGNFYTSGYGLKKGKIYRITNIHSVRRMKDSAIVDNIEFIVIDLCGKNHLEHIQYHHHGDIWDLEQQ